MKMPIKPPDRHDDDGSGMRVIRTIVVTVLIVTVIALSAANFLGGHPSASDWRAFGFDAASSRSNPDEKAINASTVGGLHLLWRAHLPDLADSSPAYQSALAFPDGTEHNVIYLTTKSGSLIALDADTGAQLWVEKNPTAGPNMVTASSPLADPDRGVVYSYGMDGKIHKYDAITGAEQFGGGWPVTVTNMPATEKESSALNAANGFLYVAMASCCGDLPPYQGHVVAIDLAHGVKHVFNTMCSDHTHLLAPGECQESGSGVWARSGVVVDPLTGNLFFSTGNGPFTGDSGGHDWGESVLELSPNATRLLDTYTLPDPNALSPQDLDLGSAAPALLPTITGGKLPYLAVQASKDGELRLLNRQNLSGWSRPGHTGGALQTIDAPDHCPVLTQPAVWTDPTNGASWIFVSNYCAIGAYRVVTSPAGETSLKLIWTVGIGASSPLVAGGVLFAASTGDNKQILALDPLTGRTLWSSANATALGNIGQVHWESPIVIGGRLYCSDEQGQVTMYGLDASPSSPHPFLPLHLFP
jgi:outer membrane protein assembly factor BamB